MRAFPFLVMVCFTASSCRGAPGPGHDGDRPEPYDGPGRKLSRDFLDGLSTWLKEKLK